MEESDTKQKTGPGRTSKVVRLLDEYDLPELGQELEESWTAEENRKSLRELAAYFNQRLLQQRLEETDIQLLDGESENIYRLLTASDVSSAERTRGKRRLEREGVDVEQLQRDFVTYQAIRTYLKEYRGAEYTKSEQDPREREITNIQQLRGRTTAVTDGKLEQLRNSGELDLDGFRTLVRIQVVCEECSTQWDVIDLLEEGGCDCLDT